MAQTEYSLYTTENGIEHINDISNALELIETPSKECIWLDISYPRTEDYVQLARVLHLHPLTQEDIEGREEREKCEFYQDYIFISARLLDEDEFYGQLRTPATNGLKRRTGAVKASATTTIKGPWESSNNIYLIVTPRTLITIHWGPLKCIYRVLNRKLAFGLFGFSHADADDTLGSAYTLSADWLAYMVLDEIVDEITEQVSLLQSEIDAIEDLTLSLRHFDQTDMLMRIYQAHRRTTIISRLIQPKQEIVNALIRTGYVDGGEDEDPLLGSFALNPLTTTYLRDVQDHLLSIRSNLQEYAESLDRAHDNYLGQGEVELAKAGHRMNLNVKRMTTLTFLLGIALTMSTMMGVNVRIPFDVQDYDFWHPFRGTLPFFILLGTELVIIGLFYSIAKRIGWV